MSSVVAPSREPGVLSILTPLTHKLSPTHDAVSADLLPGFVPCKRPTYLILLGLVREVAQAVGGEGPMRCGWAACRELARR